MSTTIRHRRGTAAQWTANNPVLAVAELGVETDTRKIKIGDGATTWASLAYIYEPVGSVASEAAIRLAADQALADLLTTGEATMSRYNVATASASTGTGVVRLSYFTAQKSETITQTRAWVGTPATATPTLCKMGLYTVDTTLTLVASTANDTALFASASTSYTKAFSASYAKVAGQRYAWAVLIVSGVATPTLYGANVMPGTEMAVAPRLCGGFAGQSDLPATIPSASVTGSGNLMYGVLLP